MKFSCYIHIPSMNCEVCKSQLTLQSKGFKLYHSEKWSVISYLHYDRITWLKNAFALRTKLKLNGMKIVHFILLFQVHVLNFLHSVYDKFAVNFLNNISLSIYIVLNNTSNWLMICGAYIKFNSPLLYKLC